VASPKEGMYADSNVVRYFEKTHGLIRSKRKIETLCNYTTSLKHSKLWEQTDVIPVTLWDT